MEFRVSRPQPQRFRQPVPLAPSTIVIDKDDAGWRLNLGGVISRFGTRFMAVETATAAARTALAAGLRLTVLIRKSDGAWQTAWSPDDPSFA